MGRNKNISAGTVDYRSGGEIRPAITGTVDEASKVLKWLRSPRINPWVVHNKK